MNNIWKLLLAIVLTAVLATGGPYVLSMLTVIPALDGHAWLILVVTTFGLILNTIFADLISGEFCTINTGTTFVF
jgi:hypothetical protein